MREIRIVKFAVYGGVIVTYYDFGEVCGLSGTKRKFTFFECKRIGVCSRERNIAHARIERIIVYCKHHAVGYIRLFDALHIVGNFNRYFAFASAFVLIYGYRAFGKRRIRSFGLAVAVFGGIYQHGAHSHCVMVIVHR